MRAAASRAMTTRQMTWGTPSTSQSATGPSLPLSTRCSPATPAAVAASSRPAASQGLVIQGPGQPGPRRVRGQDPRERGGGQEPGRGHGQDDRPGYPPSQSPASASPLASPSARPGPGRSPGAGAGAGAAGARAACGGRRAAARAGPAGATARPRRGARRRPRPRPERQDQDQRERAQPAQDRGPVDRVRQVGEGHQAAAARGQQPGLLPAIQPDGPQRPAADDRPPPRVEVLVHGQVASRARRSPAGRGGRRSRPGPGPGRPARRWPHGGRRDAAHHHVLDAVGVAGGLGHLVGPRPQGHRRAGGEVQRPLGEQIGVAAPGPGRHGRPVDLDQPGRARTGAAAAPTPCGAAARRGSSHRRSATAPAAG